MLTVRYDWLGLRAGDRVLDLGCGAGRHAFEAFRLGARVVAFDYSLAELKDVGGLMAAMTEVGEAGSRPDAMGVTCNGDATALPFADASFDRIIAAEVMEHIPADGAAMAELARVLRPGGTMAVTVPAWLAERVCWALNDEYHAPFVEGGHVRVYTEPGLRGLMRGAGLRPGSAHHAHALHTPYWWLRCATGRLRTDDHPLVQLYHRLLIWDIAKAPLATRLPDRLLNPVLGKSLVVYARKPEESTRVAA
jgi:SAM-dependent methyltransferase